MLYYGFISASDILPGICILNHFNLLDLLYRFHIGRINKCILCHCDVTEHDRK